MPVDTAALVSWLQRAQERFGSQAAKAVWGGLETRVQRGDFDAKEETR